MQLSDPAPKPDEGNHCRAKSAAKERVEVTQRQRDEQEGRNAKRLSSWFTAHLKNAGVRHRRANAATLSPVRCSSYVPIEWITPVRYTDTTMVSRQLRQLDSKEHEQHGGESSGLEYAVAAPILPQTRPQKRRNPAAH